MKCFRHDLGKVCPECGLDRRQGDKMQVLVKRQYKDQVWYEPVDYEEYKRTVGITHEISTDYRRRQRASDMGETAERRVG